MSPLVESSGPGLAERVQSRESRVKGQSDTTGHEHTHDLFTWHLTLDTCHHQVHHVVGVRQPTAPQAIDGYVAVQPQRLDMLAGDSDVLGVRIEAVNQITAVGP